MSDSFSDVMDNGRVELGEKGLGHYTQSERTVVEYEAIDGVSTRPAPFPSARVHLISTLSLLWIGLMFLLTGGMMNSSFSILLGQTILIGGGCLGIAFGLLHYGRTRNPPTAVTIAAGSENITIATDDSDDLLSSLESRGVDLKTH